MRSNFSGLFLFFALIFSAASTASAAEPVVWTFDNIDAMSGWSGMGVSALEVVSGALTGKYTGYDPILFTPKFDMAPRSGQYVKIRMKTVSRGRGEIFFASSDEGPYNGFSAENSTSWNLIHDGRWHTYMIFPTWTKLPKVTKLRLDFGSPDAAMFGKEGFAVDSVQIIDPDTATLPKTDPNWTFRCDTVGWGADNVALEKSDEGWTLSAVDDLPEWGADYFASATATPAGGLGAVAFPTLESDFFAVPLSIDRGWLSITMKTDAAYGQLRYVGSETNGIVSVPLDLDAGDEFVTYNIPLNTSKSWKGTLYYLALEAFGKSATVQKISIGNLPSGPARLDVRDLGLTEAINRVGKSLPLAVALKNVGGESAKNLTLSFNDLPEGMTVSKTADGTNRSNKIELGDLESFDTVDDVYYLTSEKPISQKISYTLSSDGLSLNGEFDAVITESLNLPAAHYVPEPQPVELQDPTLELGALYFPGWSGRDAYERIRPVAPIRKPTLGWYDEGNPEVVDWQIKWTRECGLSFFLVDWYWSRGHISLEHWIKAFQKAKYRSQFKWAMMWANHNGPGSHSVEDQTKVTQYWLDNYFNTPEYYTIDGKPVVMIWSPEGMDNDLITIERQKGNELKRGEGVKILLDLSRKMAVEAGYKGIYFIAMKWPEASTQASDIQWLADAGFDMTSIYHYMNPGKKTTDPRKFDFDFIVESNLPWLRSRQETGILPFLPNLSTGWDDRPWNNHLVIAHRTTEKFRKVCEDTKSFLAETGVKRVCMAPLNEWGEGSYALPNREFGFGMFEALRETFCKKPDGGWPLYYGPSDVGLGPYDYPAPSTNIETSWDFNDDKLEWSPAMGLENVMAADGCLKAKIITPDPAFYMPTAKLPANDFTKFKVRMKLTATDGTVNAGNAQLFWSTLLLPISETTSLCVPVTADGEFHDYEIDLTQSPYWNNRITQLRFDPITGAGYALEIDSIKLE